MRRPATLIAVVSVSLAVVLSGTAAGERRQTPSMRFFSGGAGAHADWLHSEDQPAGETDNMVVRLVTSAPSGFAGIEFRHVEGQPTASFGNSSFDVKTTNYAGPSLGSPRLEFRFSDGGRGQLRPLTLGQNWQTVSDNNWDNTGGTCGFQFQVTWQQIQSCHAGTVVTSIVLVADPYDREHRLDRINVGGKKIFSHPRDNDNAA